MPNKNHTTTLEFLGAAGEVTPSAKILKHKCGQELLTIMVDAGVTPGKNDNIIIPT
jgi:hypothetical protein